jgi:hypothetical protein
MFLTDINQTLQITLASDPASGVQVAIDYADHTSRIPVAGNLNLTVTGTLVTTILTSAPAGQQRQIKNITIYNPNISSVDVTISQVYSGISTIRKFSQIGSGKTLQYSMNLGWELTG